MQIWVVAKAFTEAFTEAFVEAAADITAEVVVAAEAVAGQEDQMG